MQIVWPLEMRPTQIFYYAKTCLTQNALLDAAIAEGFDLAKVPRSMVSGLGIFLKMSAHFEGNSTSAMYA